MRKQAYASTQKTSFYYEHPNAQILGLLPEKALSFLDVGCAAGVLGQKIKEERPDAIVHGIECNASAMAKASKVLDRVVQADLNGQFPILDGQYDCVICGDVLEHLIDPWSVLKELVLLLAPSGHVIASIPNVRHYKILRELLILGRFTYRDSGVLDATHLRFFTLREMRDLFASAGLEVVACCPCYHGGNTFLRALDVILFGRLEELRAYQYVLVGKKGS